MREWQRLRQYARASLKELLLTEETRTEISVPLCGGLRQCAPQTVA
jgi:hypothetical protein